MGDGIQLALRVARHVRAPGQVLAVLAQQAIGVFVVAALDPRASLTAIETRV
jgi:hypothetical protein